MTTEHARKTLLDADVLYYEDTEAEPGFLIESAFSGWTPATPSEVIRDKRSLLKTQFVKRSQSTKKMLMVSVQFVLVHPVTN